VFDGFAGRREAGGANTSRSKSCRPESLGGANRCFFGFGVPLCGLGGRTVPSAGMNAQVECVVIAGRANLRLSWSSSGGGAFDKDGFGAAGVTSFLDSVDCWLNTLRALLKGLKTGGPGIESFFGICFVLFVGSGGPPVVEVAFSEDDFEVDAMGAKLGGDICVESLRVVEALAFFFGKEGPRIVSRPSSGSQALVHP
jgi:hypothetical protein